MKKTFQQQIAELQEEVERLKDENDRLRFHSDHSRQRKTVIVPEQFSAVFDRAEERVRACFEDFYVQPESGEILIGGERYLLFKSTSLSYEFMDMIRELYSDRSEEEATRIGHNFLFDLAHVMGKNDAQSYHQRMRPQDAVEKLAAGPVHFAYTGWANVEILPESNPTPDTHFFLRYYHHNSFEAQSWKAAGRTSGVPVCTMSCGYSSGWCEESFGIPLTAVELECEAMGAEHCLFVMAPPSAIREYLPKHPDPASEQRFEVPVFFKKRYAEDKLRESLQQKEELLREVHHRVKNNLQIISSLLKLQLDSLPPDTPETEFRLAILRIKAMALMHETIYSDKFLSLVPAVHFFRHLFLSLVQQHIQQGIEVKTDVLTDESESVLKPDIAICLGLLVNELLYTEMKQVFISGGLLELKLRATDRTLEIELSAESGDRFACRSSPLIPLLCGQAEAELRTTYGEKQITSRIQVKK